MSVIAPFALLALSLCVYSMPSLVMNNYLLSQYSYYILLGSLIPTRVGCASNKAVRRVNAFYLLLGFVFVRMFFDAGDIPIFVQALFGFLFLCKLMYGEGSRFLQSSISQFLGRVSYGFYLWNVVWLVVLWGFRNEYPAIMKEYAVEFGVLAGCILVFPSLASAVVSEKYVEAYFDKLGRAVSSWIFSARSEPEMAVGVS